ncbi:L-type lectin-domain containing receptor kinase I.8-like [Mercurialis annua]|uniref:L-type lectin-domain containing receptor kinase I.8-like n=1 Tax=Mercurialis annua TaxID=3986 RepID=UPI00215F9ABD|nr:L-type lectin-domain containing receptor kinase I.8-like [Mercurialis annua]XP_055962243.1 L-type lectin-domain containing receptor kinase I.8-like [Mercurialis annua]XP_055962244.1 L-type lectin-domain containing receptor kinase I.8-like [Mercurialis annua]XP_055962245.1 L-type lectin-domain containing receptor kinase I.8-like [Mercurialis annua]XP_055962246.1 L-type lectin-domain containing receptor kinase I.8-like [Mercurialis annua]XP_055962247.1 L-type lectin-domain containing receptor
MISMLKLLHILLISSVFQKHLTYAQDQSNFIYNGFNGSNLNLTGLAIVQPNGLLQLSNITALEVGRAFFPLPLNFNKSLSFSTNFVFAIDPQTHAVGEILANGGHGFVFALLPSLEFAIESSTQYFGIFNKTTVGLSSNHIIAVEFDTIETVDFADINNNHVGIDVNNLVSVVSAPPAYFSDSQESKNLTLISGEPMQVWIDYDQVEMILNVTIAPLASIKPEKPLLSKNVDLSLVLLDSMYVGFSASTGTMSSYHYILGWSFNKGGPSQSLDLSQLPTLPPPPLDPRQPNPFLTSLRIVIISLAGTSFVLILIIVAACLFQRRKKFEELREDWEQEYGPQRVSYKDLYKATEGFKDKQLLGSGGFGKVYKGVLPCSDIQVAVKKFSHNSEHGLKQFVAEIASMGRLRHRNLVQLLGYCRRKGELLLVYDYMPNGSLDRFLFQNDTPNLNWVRRYQILKGVASALLYLHEEWEQIVLHRDVKASNVMLDADLDGRLGDFGLAKFHERGSIAETTCVVGTVGYLAPEVSRTGRVTTSSDVYAYGILMLEVACGRKTIEPHRPSGEVILVDWVFECWKRGHIMEISDPNLKGKYMVGEMELVLKLGLLCTHTTPTTRPTMRQVMQYLDRKAVLPEIPPDSTPRTGLVMLNQESSQDSISSSSEFKEYSSLSITSSVLNFGR